MKNTKSRLNNKNLSSKNQTGSDNNQTGSDIENVFLSQIKIDSVFDQKNKKDETIDSSPQSQKLYNDFLNFLYNGSEITRTYHFSVLEQSHKMLINF